ncbi:hypothetical protein [Pseudomonas sp.]|uniref:hypothetical protein n=1 Tax=Pseudomonas sp. TaxID=306 RepID=UPI003CC5712F
MTRWSEQPPSPDFLDLILERLPPLLSRHSSLLLKVMPPFLGFALFLQYFYRNQFYPSFDLFQFSSLLLAAACIGVLIVGYIVVLLTLPGAVIFYGYINKDQIKNCIVRHLPEAGSKRQNRVMELTALAYFAPFMTAGLLFWPSMYWFPGHVVKLMLALSILSCVPYGLLIAVRFKLPIRTALNFVWTVFFAVLLFLGLTIQVFKASAATLDLLPLWAMLSAIGALLCALAAIASISAMSHFAGWQASLLFSTFFGLMICGFSGLLTTLPETVVRAVGLGGYEAKSVELAPSFCNTGIGVQNDQSCRLESPNIVWSLGETLVLRTHGDDPVQLQIPSHQVKAIVQYPD